MNARLLLASLALLGGCGIALPEGRLRCAPTGQACPDGYRCAPDGSTCFRADHVFAPTGQPCETSTACDSGFCVDGVCCESACQGACTFCADPDHPGSCTPVVLGEDSPAGHVQCPSDCRDGLYAPDRRCDGAGGCTGQTIPCAPFLCDAQGLACDLSCSGPSECVPGAQCIAGSCGPRKLGLDCADGADCESGNCVDGVCCQAGSCPGCQACNLFGTRGTCAKVASGKDPKGDCAGLGADGDRCGSACDGLGGCKAPNPIPASGPCKIDHCTNFATPTDSVFSMARRFPRECTSARQCVLPASSPGEDCPNQLACGPADCLVGCVRDVDCVGGAHCGAAKCEQPLPDGLSCTRAFQCASHNCAVGKGCKQCNVDLDCATTDPVVVPACASSECKPRLEECMDNSACIAAQLGDQCLDQLGVQLCRCSAPGGTLGGGCGSAQAPDCRNNQRCGCGFGPPCDPSSVCDLMANPHVCKHIATWPCLSGATCASGSCIAGVCT